MSTELPDPFMKLEFRCLISYSGFVVYLLLINMRGRYCFVNKCKCVAFKLSINFYTPERLLQGSVYFSVYHNLSLILINDYWYLHLLLPKCSTHFSSGVHEYVHKKTYNTVSRNYKNQNNSLLTLIRKVL